MTPLSSRHCFSRTLMFTVLPVALCSSVLSACNYETTESVQIWLQNTRQHTKARALPLSEPRDFIPYPYAAYMLVEPFNSRKFELAYLQQHTNAGPNPDFNRRQEPLEAFPIEMIRVVGTLSNQGKKTALLQVENMIYSVQVGQYAGQNFGKIERITDNTVELTELIPDVSKTWRKRTVLLGLQETDND
jgi:type IV pilus assembly protein PilP